MTVGELVKLLESFDQDATVGAGTYLTGCSANDVHVTTYGDVVYIRSHQGPDKDGR